jgi:hypothetical protein
MQSTLAECESEREVRRKFVWTIVLIKKNKAALWGERKRLCNAERRRKEKEISYLMAT